MVDSEVLNNILSYGPVFLLIAVRALAMIETAPLMSSDAIPQVAKIALAGFTAFAVLPTASMFLVEGTAAGLAGVRGVGAVSLPGAAGVLSDLNEGQTLTRDGDAMVISGLNTSFKELNYIVGTVSDHLLYINGRTISLRDLCGKNAHITIRIK